MPNDIAQMGNTFSTRDYWLAGALLASGKKLLRLDWQGRQAHFVFPGHADCEQSAQAYWADDLKVSAKTFADALRTLKSRLYENENARQNNKAP